MNVIVRALRAVKFLELAASTVAAAVVFLIMIVVCVDVAGRYLFNSPLAWSFELISLYLMGAAFYLALSDTLRRNHHVNVDILFARFSKRTQFFWTVVGWGLSSAFFIPILVLAAQTTYSSWQSGDVFAGAIPWPTWIGPAIATFGLLLICLRLVLGTVAYTAAFTTASVAQAQERIESEI